MEESEYTGVAVKNSIVVLPLASMLVAFSGIFVDIFLFLLMFFHRSI